eukprot:7088583-Pyramimonas_sp.AAC.1
MAHKMLARHTTSNPRGDDKLIVGWGGTDSLTRIAGAPNGIPDQGQVQHSIKYSVHAPELSLLESLATPQPVLARQSPSSLPHLPVYYSNVLGVS